MCGCHSSIDLADHAEVAPDPERAHLVPHLPQRADHVELRLPGHREHVGVARVVRRHEVLVHQREHAKRLHRTMRWRPLWRWFIVCTVSAIVKSSFACSSGTATRSPSSRHRSIMSPSTWSIVYWYTPGALRHAAAHLAADPAEEPGRRGALPELRRRREQPPEIAVVGDVRVEAVVAALLLVVLAQRLSKAREGIDAGPRDDRRALVGDLLHRRVDVLELLQDGPPGVALAPVRLRRQPHRERLGEVLVRMALGVPLLQVHHEAAAVRARDVVVAVPLGRLAEELLAPAPPAQPVGVLDGVPRLVPQEPHAPLRRPALDLEHVGRARGARAAGGPGRTESPPRGRRRGSTTRRRARSAAGSGARGSRARRRAARSGPRAPPPGSSGRGRRAGGRGDARPASRPTPARERRAGPPSAPVIGAPGRRPRARRPGRSRSRGAHARRGGRAGGARQARPRSMVSASLTSNFPGCSTCSAFTTPLSTSIE